ncbi:uncharacterized protein LOC118800934 isoform X2 [Colossoma macropomum]|nr:uncharacterized protein LOC118800934 isoform X2 [Colossoma macropomum]
MINGVKTEDLPPEKFTSMLSSGSPILTMHQASIDTGINECLESDAIQPYRKEKITLHFSMAMVREECLEGEENGMDPAVCEWESDYTEDDQELLLVSMNETSVAVMSERGCDPENPCNTCGSHRCNLSEVVVAAETCEVTSVDGKNIKKCERLQLRKWINLVQYNLSNTTFISEDITVYYYTMPQQHFIGYPVVLKFTRSTNQFLKCACENQKVVLKTEYCEESKLQKICKDNKQTWPFVFYLTTAKDNTQHFESAAHRGWFIQTTYPVVTENRPEQISGSFYFVISSKSTSL